MRFLSELKRFYKRYMLLRIVSQLLLITLVYLGVRYYKSIDNIQGEAPVIVQRTLNNVMYDLRDYQKKPVLVHFWATWCPVCQFENSNIAAIAKDYQVITIASWSGSAEEVAAYLKTQNLQLPVIVDTDGEWAKLYGVKAVPVSFIVDTKGGIQFIESGYTTQAGLRLRLWWSENEL